MRKTLLTLSLSVLSSLMTASGAAAAASDDAQAFTLDPESVRIVQVAGPQSLAPLPPGPRLPGGINPDIIVNIGKIIFGIIEANRPVVDVKQSYAAAVPDGITHWAQLAGWSAPQTTTYEFTAKNIKGEKAINVRYQVFRTVGGNYQGKGKYLTGVTVEPIAITVSPGFKFYLEAAVPPESVANVGTHDDPIAGMVAMLKWKIQTGANETRGSRIYYLQGDGEFREVGDGSEAARVQAARKMVDALGSSVQW
jgi:hypothetical protein